MVRPSTFRPERISSVPTPRNEGKRREQGLVFRASSSSKRQCVHLWTLRSRRVLLCRRVDILAKGVPLLLSQGELLLPDYLPNLEFAGDPHLLPTKRQPYRRFPNSHQQLQSYWRESTRPLRLTASFL